MKKTMQSQYDLLTEQSVNNKVVPIDELNSMLVSPKDDPYIKARIDEINKNTGRGELLENEDYNN